MAGLDFYFFPGSTYTYLTVNRIERVAAEAGVTVAWRPYDLRTIIRETNAAPFFREGTAKRANMFRDIERRAAKFGIPYRGHPRHPIDPQEVVLRVALVAAEEGWCPAFVTAHYRGWFLDDRPACDDMSAVLSALGKDPDAILARIETPEVAALKEASAAAARRHGLFGSPHFVVGEETFWGDDRLEDAVAWALAHPARAR